MEHLEEIARAEAAAVDLTPEECLSYLRDNLYFYLGPRERRGLELFRRHAAKLGLAPALAVHGEAEMQKAKGKVQNAK